MSGRDSLASKEWLAFNVNHHVRAKLTDKGREILRRNHWHTLPKEDEEGWSQWQLWALMNEFGAHLRLGFDPPFETTIQIDTSEKP